MPKTKSKSKTPAAVATLPSIEPGRDPIEVKWSLEATQHLLGRRIVRVRYLSTAEAKDMGWYHRPIVFELDNGALFFPSRDDEGNDGGALFGQGPNGEEITLPVLDAR